MARQSRRDHGTGVSLNERADRLILGRSGGNAVSEAVSRDNKKELTSILDDLTIVANGDKTISQTNSTLLSGALSRLGNCFEDTLKSPSLFFYFLLSSSLSLLSLLFSRHVPTPANSTQALFFLPFSPLPFPSLFSLLFSSLLSFLFSSPLSLSHANTTGSYQFPRNYLLLSREVALVCSTLAVLPATWLSTQDFASISRFILRAQNEKQLQLQATEVVGIFQLLFSFLDGGRGDEEREGERSGEAGGESVLVVHEVIRGIAQLIMSSGMHLAPFCLELLQIMLQFCLRPSDVLYDVESKHAAIDCIGNYFIHTNHVKKVFFFLLSLRVCMCVSVRE